LFSSRVVPCTSAHGKPELGSFPVLGFSHRPENKDQSSNSPAVQVDLSAVTPVTIVDWEVFPPAPEHSKVNVFSPSVVMVIVSDPVVLLDPDHAPDAVQLVAFVVLQFRRTVPSNATDSRFEDKEIVGAGVLEFVVAELSLALLPPPPLHEVINSRPQIKPKRSGLFADLRLRWKWSSLFGR